MTEKYSAIQIKAHRLGTVKEVVSFLEHFNYAYNSIYAFNFLVDTLIKEKEIYERDLRVLDERIKKRNQYEIFLHERESTLYNSFWGREFAGSNKRRVSLFELESSIDFEKILLPRDVLVINKVNIQSPGFWEFLGSTNPLVQIREYLKDRHERKKDKKYRLRQEEELGELSIMKEKIKILESLGYPDTEIRQMMSSMIVKPLEELGNHQDIGLITSDDSE